MIRRLAFPPLIATLLVLALCIGLSFVEQPDLQAQSASMRTVTLVNGETITQPLTTGQINYGAQYQRATVFVTADISGAGTLTVTPQVSLDGEIWADALRFIPDTANGTLDELAVNKTLSADGAAYFVFELETPYLRYSIVPSGTVETTLKVMYD